MSINSILLEVIRNKGRPYVRAITLPEGLTLEHLYLTEFRNKKTLAFMTDVNNAFYVLQNRTYEIVTEVEVFRLHHFGSHCDSLNGIRKTLIRHQLAEIKHRQDAVESGFRINVSCKVKQD